MDDKDNFHVDMSGRKLNVVEITFKVIKKYWDELEENNL